MYTAFFVVDTVDLNVVYFDVPEYLTPSDSHISIDLVVGIELSGARVLEPETTPSTDSYQVYMYLSTDTVLDTDTDLMVRI